VTGVRNAGIARPIAFAAASFLLTGVMLVGHVHLAGLL
jgi:hypothetical protein